MGRRKKKNNNFRNLGLGVLVSLIGVYGYLLYVNGNFSNLQMPHITFFDKYKNQARIQEPMTPEDIIQQVPVVKKEDKKVKVFFIEHTDGKDVYRTVLRTNNTEMSDIEYAVKTLVAGPTKYERSKGVYSEIPPTKVLFVRETADRVSVNLSDSFGNGGGADSLYKRMYQLIKTVNYNTSKPVYLLMNGQLVETIGGEGLMLKQPLNGSSLDD